ncbi:hypothetical protein EBAPG3_009405 [Nitrosospira lacus]|uniref:Uncharacterized protein n=1 Tax=Nitrosospira lacus TaxID=1288494 RepID=A0A1W6SQ95_9PROT|nr:hypothetical protein [Nitrosospira lacus]ARO87965.1 hypothetical protein EBAPG3_009405 [Nitrosospira lacus]
MPQHVRTQVTTRPVLNPLSAPQTQQVVARPTDQLAAPIQDPELLGLVRGLSTFHPALQQYAVVSGQANADRDIKAGAAAKQQGKPVEEGSSDWYRHGYLMMDGQVKGDLDGKEVTQAYETEFDKDTGNIDDFVRDQFQKRTNGLTDQSALEGYNQTIIPHLQKIRDAHLEYQKEAVSQKVESNALAKLDNYIRPFAENGEPIPDEGIDQLRGDLGKFFGVTGKRYNDLLFSALDRLGKEGNYSVYDSLKKTKPDGTPGMYFIPAWKERIDAAQIHSQNVYLAKRSAADAALKKEREDRQDTALYDVFIKMDTDPAAAKVEYARLRSEGLFSRASDVINWDTKFNAASKREASAEQQDQEVTLQQGIYTGKVRPQQIVQADITPAQKRSLIAEWYRVKNDNRQAAAAGQTSADAIYRTQDFRSGESYIETVLRPQASPLDPMGIGTEFARQQMAAARREFTIRSRDVKAPYELQGLAQEIATRYLDRRKDPRIQQELDMAGTLRYSTVQELMDARKAGLITDHVELENHIRYFKAVQAQQTSK